MPPAINHHEHNTDSPMTIGNIPHWNINGACAGVWSAVNEGSSIKFFLCESITPIVFCNDTVWVIA